MNVPDSIPENTSRNTHNVVAELLFAGKTPGKVLDIPCGQGAFTKRLIDRDIAVVSGDVENICMDPRADFQVCDMSQRLPFGDGELDAVVCIDGIEHIERPFDFVREASRVLEPGGAFILSTPNISALRSRWRYLMTGFHNKGKTPLNETEPDPLHHINLLPFQNLRYMLHSNGFEIDEVRCNRVKGVSWLFAPLVPLVWLLTTYEFNKEEKDPAQRRRNWEIRKQMCSSAVMFGETVILRSVKS